MDGMHHCVGVWRYSESYIIHIHEMHALVTEVLNKSSSLRICTFRHNTSRTVELGGILTRQSHVETIRLETG